MRLSRLAALLLGPCMLLALSAQAAPPPDSMTGSAQQDFVPGEVIVKFKTPAAGMALKNDRAAIANARLEDFQGLPFGMSVLKFVPTTKSGLANEAAATWEAIEQLRARPDVEFAHPNYRFQFTRVP